MKHPGCGLNQDLNLLAHFKNDIEEKSRSLKEPSKLRLFSGGFSSPRYQFV